MAESIVGAVVNFVGEKLLECVAEPIKRWYNYLFRFYSNVEKLSEAKRKLKDARDGLQMLVDRAKNNAEVILPQVKTWLEETDEVLAIMVEIESEITDIQSVWLTKKFYRFSLSKKVKKTTETMEQLLGDCNFDVISQPAAPASMVPFPIGPTHEFESRKNIEKDVMSTLRDEKVSMMGICGMGGVGKTTMAKRVMNRMKGERMFDETVMVVVSQQVDMLKIQNELAEQLGLTLEVESLSARAHKLRTRLVGGKRILMVIDDVWKNLELEDLGMPRESDFKECTILLTSRDRGVLNEMGAQKVCEIQTLSKSEAWSLFQEKVGRCIDDQNLLAIAQEVVKECKGLPIAIVSVATALKDVKYKFQWDDALEQLKSSDPIDMPKVLEDVYKPLKLSYDFLGNQHAKSIFLLCCLFPEDSTIPLEELTAYALGLCIFERIRNLEQVRNRIYSLVEVLKNRFLLLEGWDQYHVRMHDVVRDVAIFIALEEKNIKCGDCTWISPYLGEGIKLSLGSVFPNLRLLWIINKSADEELQISDNFFEGTTKLNVLSMTRYSLRSLPHSTKLLKNLRTLILYSCESLETISIVGLLVNLEILICRHCDRETISHEVVKLIIL